MSGLVNFVIENDWTAWFAVLVWVGIFLTIAWVTLMGSDPANEGLSEWDLRLRRFGVIAMLVGFIVSILLGGDRRWAPWPSMLLVVFGFDFYLAAALLTRHRRRQIRARLEGFGGVSRFVR